MSLTLDKCGFICVMSEGNFFLKIKIEEGKKTDAKTVIGKLYFIFQQKFFMASPVVSLTCTDGFYGGRKMHKKAPERLNSS